ncbi:hypothetical protein LRN74_24945, partial [Escherichia coli]|uniref:hypothetical protein n=1 Tax=Escherichia coli TaxID=562 RepID=UPI001F325AB4
KFGVMAHFIYKNKSQGSEPGKDSKIGWVGRFVPSLMKMTRAEKSLTQTSAPTPRWLTDLNTAAEEFEGEEAFK